MAMQQVRRFDVGIARRFDPYHKIELTELAADLSVRFLSVPQDCTAFVEFLIKEDYNDYFTEMIVHYNRLETEAEAQERVATGVANTKRLEDAERIQLEKLKAKYEK